VTPTSPTRVTAGDWIRAAAARHPDRVHLDDTGEQRRLTFGEVEQRVRRLGNGLLAMGLRTGQRVALLATDSHRVVETLYASMRIGTTFVPLNVRLAEREIFELLRLSQARVLFVGARYVEMARRLAEELPTVEQVVGYDGASDGVLDYETLLRGADEHDPRVFVPDDAILGLAFTSGTTGRPKGVLQSQRMVKESTLTTLICWETQPEEVYYCGAPLFHISAMDMVFMTAVRGLTYVLAPAFDPAAVHGWLRAGKLTSLFLVPTMISAVLQQPAVHYGGYGRLRAVHYGAAPMPLALLRTATAVFGCDFVQAFGAGTESGWNTVLSSADHRRALDGADHLLRSVGRAAPGVELRLCDDDWRDVPRGEVGEVVVRSDMIMSGYLDDPVESARSLHPDGWFRAGDLGYQDEDGYLYLVGRKRDMVVRGGENIYPAEVETVLFDHPAVLECAVVGVPDEHWGEVLRAHLVLRPATAATAGELVAHCRTRLAGYKVPARWVFEAELPKNASGKILKRVLADRTDAEEVR
jgi:acyl-CoA synthetase (AMP-forming)/AMP-acid ligase II